MESKDVPITTVEKINPEVLYQARIIIARQKFWTPDLEKLLRRWRKQVNTRSFEYRLLERKYNKRYYLLGVPASILSTIVASGVLTTFKNCNECVVGCVVNESSACASDEWVRLAMGIIGILAIVFTCLSLFMNYGEAKTECKEAATNYENLTRRIDSILDTPVSAREDPISCMNSIRSEFDDISSSSPTIASSIETLEYRTLKMASAAKISVPHISLKPEAKDLAKSLVEKIEKEGKERATIKRQIEDENNYDTEEEKDVTLAFDLEAMKPEDLVEVEKKKSVQESLKKALEFELARMYTDAPPRDKDILETPKTPKKKRRPVLRDTGKGKEDAD